MQTWNEFVLSNTEERPDAILFDGEARMLRARNTFHTVYKSEPFSVTLAPFSSDFSPSRYLTVIITDPGTDRYVLHPAGASPPKLFEPGISAFLKLEEIEFPPGDPEGDYRLYALLTDRPLDPAAVQAWLEAGDALPPADLDAVWGDQASVFARCFRLASRPV